MSNTERSSEDTEDKSRTTSKGNERRQSQIRSENTETGDKQPDGAGDKRIASLSLKDFKEIRERELSFDRDIFVSPIM